MIHQTAAVVACFGGLATIAAAASKKPNLLFMMADQLRADTQGADARFGGAPNTPNLVGALPPSTFHYTHHLAPDCTDDCIYF